jgi:hypothetical protein
MALDVSGYTYITHKRIQRPWGPECRYTVKRQSDGKLFDDVISISSLAVTDESISNLIVTRLAQMQEMEDYEAKFSHHFDDIGPEVREALNWLIRKIRQYPNATYAQAESQWNNEWADSLFTFARLSAYVQNMVGGVTWAEFKTYAISHNFEGID